MDIMHSFDRRAETRGSHTTFWHRPLYACSWVKQVPKVQRVQRVSPLGVPPFDCMRKRFSGFYRFKRFNGVGVAHKKQKRREGLKLAVFSYRKPNP